MNPVAAAAATTPRPHRWRPRRRTAPRRRLPLWAQIAAKLPPATAPARTQSQWLTAVDDALDASVLRADAAGNVRAIAHVLALHATWRTPMITRPTWQRLAERTGLSRRTVCNHLHWLRDHQLLAVWQTGRSAQFTPMALAGTQPNQAGEYLLLTPAPAEPPPAAALEPTAADPGQHSPTPTVPPAAAADQAVDETCPPTWSRRDLDQNPRTRDSGGPQGRRRGPGKPAQTRADRRRWHDPGRPARLTLAERLQQQVLALRTLSTAHLASLIRGHVNAGWELRDFTWAIDHRPDSRQHWHTHEVHSPGGWLTHRLDHWRDDTGAPVFSPTRLARSAHWQNQARQARDARNQPPPAKPGAAATAKTALRDALAQNARSGTPAVRA